MTKYNKIIKTLTEIKIKSENIKTLNYIKIKHQQQTKHCMIEI